MGARLGFWKVGLRRGAVGLMCDDDNLWEDDYLRRVGVDDAVPCRNTDDVGRAACKAYQSDVSYRL